VIRARYLLQILLLAVPVAEMAGQEVTTSVLNVFRYGEGKTKIGDLKDDVTYIEELMELRVGLPKHVTVGVRLLFDIPPEIGPTFRGIQRRYAELTVDDIMLRAGHSSQLFGRGLSMNLFEDRGLAYDTWMDGVKMTYDGDFIRGTALAGRVEYWDSIVVARTEIYDLRAANLEVHPFDWMLLGGSFVATDGKIPGSAGETLLEAEIPELYGSLRVGGLELYAAWAEKRTNVLTDTLRSAGSGIYGALSWTGDGVGVALDYKDYRFDPRDPFERNDPTRATRMLPIQNPPIVLREHTWFFLTRALHQVNFDDEVGFQLEGYLSLGRGTTLTLNASLASEHDFYEYDPTTFAFTKTERERDYLPSTDPALSPYWEVLLEGEHYFGNRGVVRLAAAHRQYTLAVLFPGATDHLIRSTVIPGLMQIPLFSRLTATVQLEHEQVSDNYNIAREEYYNQLVALNFSWAPAVTVGGRIEFTSNPSDLSGRDQWFALDLGYRIGGAHTVVLTLGQQRGGQICVNGVCRYIQPFSGVRLTMQSNI
jgi:hypothetical protein